MSAPFIQGWWSTRQKTESARSARFDELRSVVDEAAVALIQFMESLPSSQDVAAGNIEPRLPAMNAALTRIWQRQARISVRLGANHDVTLSYTAAHNAAGNWLVFYREMVLPTPRPSLGLKLSGVSSVQALAYREFFDAASKLIGPERKPVQGLRARGVSKADVDQADPAGIG